MPEMNLGHIDLISSDIRKQEITFSHLLDELIDHVCCDVEYEMQHGLDFSDAYKKVRGKIGYRGLKEIQEETLFAVDTKYRKMKNTMKISGIAGNVMLGFAAVFKILHFPGGSILLFLGAITLAFIFMPSAMVVLWKETHSKKRLFLFVSAFLTGASFLIGVLFKTNHWPASGLVLSFSILTAILLFLPSLLASKLADKDQAYKRPVYILGFISMIIYLASFWFKVQHWPFATILMTLSSFILIVIVLPWYTWITWKEEKNISNTFIFMVLAIALFVIPGALVSLSMQNQYDAEFFIHQDQQKAIVNYRLKSNEKLLMAYKDSIVYNKLSQIHLKTTDLIGKIDQMELKMIELSEEKPTSENTSKQTGATPAKEIKYNYLQNPYNVFIVKFMLSPGADSRTGLDKSIKSYVDFITENTSIDFVKSYESVLNPSVYLPDANPYLGENALISGLHALELLRNGILVTENGTLRQIISH
jgi:hypothetical protein